MSHISAVIITLNEERNIKRCLTSLQGVADEIIVLDSGSHDNTKAVCKTFENVKFITRNWEGYAASKNYANSLASCDYILSLDADEALSEELKKSILTVKPDLNGAYKFARLTNYCGTWIRHCGWYPDHKIRLFCKGRAQWTGDYVHETLTIDDLEVTLLKGDLLHYSFYTADEHIERIEKYAGLAAREKFDEGKKGSVFKGALSGIIRFFNIYFLKLGFLDGRAGFDIARYSAYASYLKYKKLIKLRRHER